MVPRVVRYASIRGLRLEGFQRTTLHGPRFSVTRSRYVDPMLIDCDSCLAKDIACDDCVISVIFKGGFLDGGPVELDHDEADALSALAKAGLIPQLRLVPRSPQTATVEPWKDSAAG